MHCRSRLVRNWSLYCCRHLAIAFLTHTDLGVACLWFRKKAGRKHHTGHYRQVQGAFAEKSRFRCPHPATTSPPEPQSPAEAKRAPGNGLRDGLRFLQEAPEVGQFRARPSPRRFGGVEAWNTGNWPNWRVRNVLPAASPRVDSCLNDLDPASKDRILSVAKKRPFHFAGILRMVPVRVTKPNGRESDNPHDRCDGRRPERGKSRTKQKRKARLCG